MAVIPAAKVGTGKKAKKKRGKDGEKKKGRPHAQKKNPKNAPVTTEAEREPDVGEEDVEFFNQHEEYSSFLNSMKEEDLKLFGKNTGKEKQTQQPEPKKKRKREDSEEEELENMLGRRTKASTPGWGDSGPKQLLPKIGLRDDGSRHIQKQTAQQEAEQLSSTKKKKAYKKECATVQTEQKAAHKQDRKTAPDNDDDAMSVDDEEGEDEEPSGSEVDAEPSTLQKAASGNKRSVNTSPFSIKAGADLINTNLSTVVMRTQLRAQKKAQIAELCEAILEDPEKALTAKDKEDEDSKTKMEKLFLLINDDDLVIQQLATISQLAVLGDILPSYRIRLPTAKELHQKISKEVRKTREYEAAMLGSYQKYLKHLEALAKAPGGNEQAKKGKNQRQQLKSVAYKCLCSLLGTHATFNFGANLIGAVVQGVLGADEAAAEQCGEALRALLRSDPAGEVMLEGVRAVVRAVEGKLKTLKPGAGGGGGGGGGGGPVRRLERGLAVLRAAPLRVTEDQGLRAKKRARNQAKALKRERKSERAARAAAAEAGDEDEAAAARAAAGLRHVGGRREALEGEAVADPVARAAAQAKALQEVTLLYFRILKEPRARGLLPAALENLAAVAHLINLDTVEDLVALLQEMVYDPALALPPRATLQAVATALRTLQGPGKELQVDEKAFVIRLYQLMPSLATSSSHEIQTLLRCIDIAFLKKTELSSIRVAGFMKRLASLCLLVKQPTDTFNILRCIRRLLEKYKQTQQMLETGEDKCASGAYRGDLDDPEHANPYAAALWELAALRRHPHPGVAAEAAAAAQAKEIGFGETKTILSPTETMKIEFEKLKKPWYTGKQLSNNKKSN